MNTQDLLGRIVYFEYNGNTEQGWVKNIVAKDYVTVCSFIHEGWYGEGLYTEMPVEIGKLFLNPLKNENK